MNRSEVKVGIVCGGVALCVVALSAFFLIPAESNVSRVAESESVKVLGRRAIRGEREAEVTTTATGGPTTAAITSTTAKKKKKSSTTSTKPGSSSNSSDDLPKSTIITTQVTISTSTQPERQVAFGSGPKQVGVSVFPGTYTASSSDCYWERYVSAGPTLSIVVERYYGAGSTTVTIQPDDVSFYSEGCGDWYRV